MAIPAGYFTKDETGTSQADRDVSAGLLLLRRLARIVGDIQTGVTLSGEPLTAAQIVSIRNRYTTWRTEVQTWFGSLPTP